MQLPTASDYRAALAADRPAEALDLALAAWRETHHPAIAGCVRAASKLAVDRFAAPGGRSKELFHAAWREVATSDPSAAATGWLASRLEDLLPIEIDRYAMLRPNGLLERHAPLHQRVALLSARGADPRIADALIVILRNGRYGFWDQYTTEQIYRSVLDALLVAGDPGAAQKLWEMAADPRARRANLRDWLVRELPPIADQLARIAVQELPSDEADAWAALGPPPDPAPPADVTTYLEAVYADPADDSLRAVLSDVLLQAGDPRGELIALQLAGPLSDVQGKRARQILRAHQDDWLGPDLAPVLGAVVFKRGFLEECELRQNAAASAETWKRASQDPRLATVRVLRQGQGNKTHYAAFVNSPAARDLRVVEIPTAGFLDELAAGPPRTIEELEFPRAPNRKMLSRMATSPALVNARSLSMPAGFEVGTLLADLEATLLHQLLRSLVVTPMSAWSTFRELAGQKVKGADLRGEVLARFDEVVARLTALERLVFVTHATELVFTRAGAGWACDVRHLGGYATPLQSLGIPPSVETVRVAETDAKPYPFALGRA